MIKSFLCKLPTSIGAHYWSELSSQGSLIRRARVCLQHLAGCILLWGSSNLVSAASEWYLGVLAFLRVAAIFPINLASFVCCPIRTITRNTFRFIAVVFPSRALALISTIRTASIVLEEMLITAELCSLRFTSLIPSFSNAVFEIIVDLSASLTFAIVFVDEDLSDITLCQLVGALFA